MMIQTFIQASLGLFIQDGLGILGVSGAIVGTFAFSEVLRSRAKWASERTRKFVHILCGSIVFFFPYLFHSVHTLGVLSASFAILLMTTRLLGFMQSIHAVRRKSLGVFYYTLAIYTTGLLTWGQPHGTTFFQISVLLLAFGDGLAALIGKNYGRHRYLVGTHPRTIEGSATVFWVSLLASFVLLFVGNVATLPVAFCLSVILAALVTVVEALSLWGIDNLTIPLSAAFFLNSAQHWSYETLQHHMIAFAVALVVAVACRAKRSLSVSGAFAAWLVGYLVYGFGGALAFLPLLSFFLAVNRIGKFSKKWAPRVNEEVSALEEKGRERDFAQVFANAGVPVLLVLLAQISPIGIQPLFFAAILGSLCAASADTFASELGVLSKSLPVSIWGLKPIQRGLSGGVTVLGYFAAALGAVVPALTAWAVLIFSEKPLVQGITQPAFLKFILFSLICGILGSTVDSLMGATLQWKTQCLGCRKITERKKHCLGFEAIRIQGKSWMSNDAVNAVGSLIGAIAGAALSGIL